MNFASLLIVACIVVSAAAAPKHNADIPSAPVTMDSNSTMANTTMPGGNTTVSMGNTTVENNSTWWANVTGEKFVMKDLTSGNGTYKSSDKTTFVMFYLEGKNN